jgi:hypothetical protein
MNKLIAIFFNFHHSVSFLTYKKEKPVFYIIGDSTVKNGDGTGKNNQMGWGTVITPFFDTTKIDVRNHAIGGRSSRTFITDGRWDKILETLKKGDYVIMQFGHNDASPLDDTARARGTIKGLGMTVQKFIILSENKRSGAFLWLVYAQVCKGYKSKRRHSNCLFIDTKG